MEGRRAVASNPNCPSPLHGACALLSDHPGFPHPFGVRSPGAKRPSSLRDSKRPVGAAEFARICSYPAPDQQRDIYRRVHIFNTLGGLRASGAIFRAVILGMKLMHNPVEYR